MKNKLIFISKLLLLFQHKEAEFLQKLLPGYYMNLNQNPHTLLPKFFGMYTYQCNQKNIRVTIMNNLLPSNIKMHLKFDLKGSTFKRKVRLFLHKFFLSQIREQMCLDLCLETHFQYEFSILGRFGQSGLQRKKIQTAISMLLLGQFFLCFHGQKHIFFFK